MEAHSIYLLIFPIARLCGSAGEADNSGQALFLFNFQEELQSLRIIGGCYPQDGAGKGAVSLHKCRLEAAPCGKTLGDGPVLEGAAGGLPCMGKLMGYI